MASLPATESDYDFVEKPSEDFFCAVTLDFLREPHQMLCCGNHLSPVAVTRLQGQPCPMCKEPNLNTVPDKFFKRKVNELKIRCPNKSLRCEWVGELGSLDRHLSQNSVEGECQFVTVACPCSCGDGFQRCQLKGHRMNDCPNRPFTCRYCNYKTTYVKVTDTHWPICKQYPLKCPNQCGENVIQRQHLPKHLEEACPLQVIRCEFSYAGCEIECQRQYMQTHLDENMRVHLTKVSCKTKQQQQAIEQQQDQIDTLMAAMSQVVFIHGPSVDIVMTDFEEHKKAKGVWHSPPFYSHIGGYRMCLRVDANGGRNGKGTHVSVYVLLMSGEHDDLLKWPFRGVITLQLLNQKWNGGHQEHSFSFDHRVSKNADHRVVGTERASSGCGRHQFIAHNELSAEDKEYLKNDCLKFRITKAEVFK